MTEAPTDGLDFFLDGITVCLEDEGRDSAILGVAVHLVNDQGETKDLEVIGPKTCPTRKVKELMHLKGKTIG